MTGTARFSPAMALGLVAFALAYITALWIGYLQSDDYFYSVAARGWLDDFPYIGTTHWGLRHTIVLPLALSFSLFGISELSLILPITVYAILLLAGIWVFVRRRTDDLTAALAVLVAASLPLLAEGASFVATDLAEAFFVLLSFWLFYRAAESRQNRGILVGSGIAAGFAWITRETSISLLAFYGILFLFSRRLPRSSYFWMAGGFLTVWLADTIYLGVNTGDFLYRINTSLRGVSRDNPALAAQFATMEGFDPHGNVATPSWIRPLTMLFGNRSFALLFWVGIPAAIHLCFSASIPSKVRDLMRMTCGLALTWFFVLSYVMYWLWDIPRYQTVTAVAACIAIGVWVRYILLPRSGIAAVTLMACIIAASTLAGLVGNAPPLFGERAVVAWAGTYNEPIYTDDGTLQGAGFLLETDGRGGKVVASAPPPGALYAYNSAPRRKPSTEPLKPDLGWTVVERRVEKEKVVGGALRALGVLPHIPAWIAAKLAPKPRTVTLYRVT